MNCVSWNCRGVGNRLTVAHAKELMSRKGVGACCLLETKTTNAQRMKKMAMRLGFDQVFEVAPLGFAGGLLLFWNKAIMNLEVVGHSSQAIHCMVKGWGRTACRITFAYVRSNRIAKDQFWEECKIYSDAFEGPWIVMSDFNDILSVSEQWGNEDVNHSNINRLIEAIHRCRLLDLHNAGPRFSRVRQVGGRVVLRKKLDKVLWNMDAQLAFPEGKAMTLAKTHSDHHQIMFLREAGDVAPREVRPFRFEGA